MAPVWARRKTGHSDDTAGEPEQAEQYAEPSGNSASGYMDVPAGADGGSNGGSGYMDVAPGGSGGGGG